MTEPSVRTSSTNTPRIWQGERLMQIPPTYLKSLPAPELSPENLEITCRWPRAWSRPDGGVERSGRPETAAQEIAYFFSEDEIVG